MCVLLFSRESSTALDCRGCQAALPTAGRYAEAAFGELVKSNRGDWIRTSDLTVPKRQNTQAEKHRNPCQSYILRRPDRSCKGMRALAEGGEKPRKFRSARKDCGRSASPFS